MKKAHSFFQKSGGMTDIHEPEEEERRIITDVFTLYLHLVNTMPKWKSILLGLHSVQMVRNTTHLSMWASSSSTQL